MSDDPKKELKNALEEIFSEEGNTKLEYMTGDSIELGKVYPLYGVLTKILEDTPEKLIAEINGNIKMTLNNPKEEHKHLLQRKFMEPSIFFMGFTKVTKADEMENLKEDEYAHEATCVLMLLDSKGLSDGGH